MNMMICRYCSHEYNAQDGPHQDGHVCDLRDLYQIMAEGNFGELSKEDYEEKIEALNSLFVRKAGSPYRTDDWETLQVLAEATGLNYHTLLGAAKTGRLMARKSGSTWLSTASAIEYSRREGRLR